MKRLLLAALAAPLALAACSDEPAANSGVTAEESRQLDNAAEMLDAAPSDPTPLAPEPVEPGYGENPNDDIGDTGELPVKSDAATE